MHWISYTIWLIGQVLAATATVARDTVRIHNRHHPIVVYYPLRITSDWHRTVFSTSITMTPGTLSIGFRPADEVPGGSSSSGLVLLVHAVYGEDPRGVIDSLADMEARVNPGIADIPVEYKPWMYAGDHGEGYRSDINFPMAERDDYWEPLDADPRAVRAARKAAAQVKAAKKKQTAKQKAEDTADANDSREGNEMRASHSGHGDGTVSRDAVADLTEEDDDSEPKDKETNRGDV